MIPLQPTIEEYLSFVTIENNREYMRRYRLKQKTEAKQ